MRQIWSLTVACLTKLTILTKLEILPWIYGVFHIKFKKRKIVNARQYGKI